MVANVVQGAVADLIEHGPHVWEVGSSIPKRVKPMTLKLDACHYLARISALLE